MAIPSGSRADANDAFVPPLAAAAAGPKDTDASVSNASRRLRALAALSGSLTDPLTPEEAADLVEQQALTVLGASSAVVVTLTPILPNATPDRSPTSQSSATSAPLPSDILTLVHAIGLPADVRATLQRFPIDAPLPLAEVARTGEPMFLRSEVELRQYAEWGGALIRAGACAVAAVPVWANRHLRGVLGLTWATPHEFDDDERAFVVALGVMCAQAIIRGRLTLAERRARETAELANQAKTQFLRTISHELRTPMTAIVGYTGLLADEISGTINTVQRDHLRRMHDSSEHLLALIEELLGFARLDSGQEPIRIERVVAGDVIGQALELIMPLAQSKNLRVRVELPDTPIELHTDPLKLRQILVNLLANAVKYTDEGSVVLILRVEGTGAELRIYFEVTDSGRGISEEHHQRVFESFWRVDQTLTGKHAGTGLGLAVARQLARLLGGDVVIAKSELGHGSTFIATIPAQFVPLAVSGSVTAH